MTNIPQVMISSTSLDLPEHREAVRDACYRQRVFPVMMEHLPAQDVTGLETSLSMVDDVDGYIGILGHRYGYIPVGNERSITEMEYHRAVERGIPCLMFVLDHTHEAEDSQRESEQAAAKLQAFKDRVLQEKTVRFFSTVDSLRAEVIDTLSRTSFGVSEGSVAASDLPRPPEPYAPHPYTLIHTGTLVGRRKEQQKLGAWARGKNPILCLVAIGGAGKSALAWTWFSDGAGAQFAGRLWWSFYDGDLAIDTLIVRALAYVTGDSLAKVEALQRQDREEKLLRLLDQQPYLLVLDGVERLLLAYARMDAARLSDEELDARLASEDPALLRRCVDPGAGSFLRKLLQVRASKILITSRLLPADLEAIDGRSCPGCETLHLRGLTDADALSLWRAHSVGGSDSALLPLFHRVENHPLVINALASEVAHDRRAPGDFTAWRRRHPQLDPGTLPLERGKAHVLAVAMSALADGPRHALRAITALRLPMGYDTLTGLLIGSGRPLGDESVLDRVLSELENRGLIGWDRVSNRYDAHPIVRGAVWGGLGAEDKAEMYAAIHEHFSAMPPVPSSEQVMSLEDLSSGIEMFNALVGMERWIEATVLFQTRLQSPLRHRLARVREEAELLELLVPAGVEALEAVERDKTAAWVRKTLAEAYHRAGRLGESVALLEESLERAGEDRVDAIGIMRDLSDVLLLTGKLYSAEFFARDALLCGREVFSSDREARTLLRLGTVLRIRGETGEARRVLERALTRFTVSRTDDRARTHTFLAHLALDERDIERATRHADEAWQLGQSRPLERDMIRTLRVQGTVTLAAGDRDRADEQLRRALGRARDVQFAQEELPSLVALAEIQVRRGNLEEARRLLDDVWDAVVRAPFPLVHADALLVLSRIEQGAGNMAESEAAAEEAYRLAWLDGPPFAYQHGLEAARGRLAELGVPEPADVQVFDAAGRDAMPEVDIEGPAPRRRRTPVPV